jgi:hypothetical protein
MEANCMVTLASYHYRTFKLYLFYTSYTELNQKWLFLNFLLDNYLYRGQHSNHILYRSSAKYPFKKHIRMASTAGIGIGYKEKISRHDSERLELQGENQSDRLGLINEDLLFIESYGNYVAVNHRISGGFKKTLLRATLKNMEEQLERNPEFFRCHRAYLVNLYKIEDVKGNAQGYRVRLSETNVVIPVSRSYLESFNRAVIKIKNHS